MARILLVEDDPDVRPMLARILQGAGYGVDVTETAAKANLLLETSSYDLVLTDVELPDGNGLAIADRTAARGIKVLIISGYEPEQESPRYEFVKKPMRSRDLLDAVARKLGSA